MCVCICVCIRIRIYACVCMCIYICVFLCVCVYIPVVVVVPEIVSTAQTVSRMYFARNLRIGLSKNCVRRKGNKRKVRKGYEWGTQALRER